MTETESASPTPVEQLRPGDQASLSERKGPAPVAAMGEASEDPSTAAWSETLSHAFHDHIGQPSRQALHKFFYPPVRGGTAVASEGPATSPTTEQQQQQSPPQPLPPLPPPPQKQPPSSENGAVLLWPPPPAASLAPPRTPGGASVPAAASTPWAPPRVSTQPQLCPPQEGPPRPSPPPPSTPPLAFWKQQQEADQKFVEHFWTTYDDILILFVFTQVGIVFRLASSTWFHFFDGVFSNDSALFVNLPLNCLSCFIMGLLSSGERLMQVITTRFTPPLLQTDLDRRKRPRPGGGASASFSDEEERSLRPVRDDAHSYHYGQDHDGDEEDYDDNNMNYRTELDLSGDEDDDDDDHMERSGGPGRVMTLMASSSSLSSRSSSPDGGLLSSSDSPRRRGVASRFLRRRGRSRRTKRSHLPPRPRRRRPASTAAASSRDDPAEKDVPFFRSWQPPIHLNEELRDVQLLALERRIRASKCLVLFPVRKEDIDVMEHYFQDGYQREGGGGGGETAVELGGGGGRTEPQHHVVGGPLQGMERRDFTSDLELQESIVPTPPHPESSSLRPQRVHRGADPPAAGEGQDHHGDEAHGSDEHGQFGGLSTIPLDDGDHARPRTQSHPGPTSPHTLGTASSTDLESAPSPEQAPPLPEVQPQPLDQIFTDVTANVHENISRLRRVQLADGWDVGTSAEAMSDDLMLGLRDGFCGALSSFSSWNSAMVGLMRDGRIGEALVGYMLGLQLPILAYRFGQHVAVYIFVWRCRREARRDERRGYGIRLSMNDHSEGNCLPEVDGREEQHSPGGVIRPNASLAEQAAQQQTPSVRAIITAIFIMAVVTQCTSMSFFRNPANQQVALSLLFSPLGVFARWRLSKYNSWWPSFPIGTFACNIGACLLSGGLGTILAGHPGPRERIVLVSFIAGFGGTLSSVAAFVIEVLAGVDPILFRFDGVVYAILSVFWAMVVGFIFSSSVDWADQTN